MYPYDFVPWGETDCGRSNKTITNFFYRAEKHNCTAQVHLLDNTRVYCSLTLSMSGGERKRPPTHPSVSTTTAHTHPHTQKHIHTSTFKKSREKDTNYALVLAITPQLSNLDPLCHKCLQESVLHAPAYIMVLVFFQVSCTVWSIWTRCHVAKKKRLSLGYLAHTHTHIHSTHIVYHAVLARQH